MNEFDDERTLVAQWCIDSETGQRVLIDSKTGQVIITQEELDNESKRV